MHVFFLRQGDLTVSVHLVVLVVMEWLRRVKNVMILEVNVFHVRKLQIPTVAMEQLILVNNVMMGIQQMEMDAVPVVQMNLAPVEMVNSVQLKSVMMATQQMEMDAMHHV